MNDRHEQSEPEQERAHDGRLETPLELRRGRERAAARRAPVLGSLAEALPDALLVHEGGRVVEASGPLGRLLARPARALVGTTLDDLLAPADRARVLAHLAAGDETPIEASLVREDGTPAAPCELFPRTVVVDGAVARLLVVRDRTAAWRREVELGELVDRSTDIVSRYDGALRLVFINAAGARAAGRPREALLGLTAEEFLAGHPAAAAWMESMRHVLATGQTVEGDLRWTGLWGTDAPRDLVIRLTPERDATGAIVTLLATARDVTDTRRAEEAARTARELRDALFDQVTIGIGIASVPDGRFVAVNPAAAAMFGYTPEELRGRRVADVYPPEDHPALAARAARLVEGTLREYSGEFRYRRRDGTDGWMRAGVSALRDAAGRPTHLVGAVHDVTDWKRAEEQLRVRERLLRDGEHLAGFGTWAWALAEARVTWSDEVYRIFGRDPRAGVATHAAFLTSVHPDDRARVDRAITAAVAARGTYDEQFRIRRPDGEVRLVRERAFVETAPDGTAVRLVGVTQDVTEREAAERALRQSEERFRALVEHTSDLIAILDADGTNRYASPSHERVLGLPPEGLQGRSCFDYTHPEDLPALRAAFARAFDRATGDDATPTPPQPFRFRHADGSWRTLLVTLIDLRATPGVGGIVANSRDVTEQLALEERLRQSQKLEALGQLAGGVAHDFNNILAAILGFGQMVRDALAEGDPRREDAEQVMLAAARGTGITRQLLAFSRRQTVDTEVLDLTAAVRDTGRMLRALVPPAIVLELPAAHAPPVLVRAARAQIAQIVLNLALNARDAMPDGGTLTIAVDATPDATPTRTGDGAAARGRTARLVVRDTGVGIPPEARGRLFEPFFTTKPPGQGTGLGLATVYGLTRQFGGTIAVESEVGHGATFVVALPLAAAPEASATATPDGAPGGGASRAATRARVLVVEDEAPIRAIARRALEGAGYAVAEAEDGVHALARLRGGEPYDLVLTDAAMPGMSGWQLAAEIAAAPVPLPVVVMSGNASLPDAHAGSAHVAGYVEKPFSPRRLVEAVEEALGK